MDSQCNLCALCVFVVSLWVAIVTTTETLRPEIARQTGVVAIGSFCELTRSDPVQDFWCKSVVCWISNVVEPNGNLLRWPVVICYLGPFEHRLTVQPLVECIPNFSEGRKPETLARIAEAIKSTSDACVLDTHIDPDHNRSVITFVAPPEQVVDAAVRAVTLATELIDMRSHLGEHPRLGATDVLPFVPLAGITFTQCVQLAHEAGRRIAGELGIPVYFYERAALRPDRVNLEDVRRGALELLREEIATNPARLPDVGAPVVHETAGAIAVGARPFLIAFNVILRSTDILLAKQIARAIRGRHGGLPFLKALGFQLHTRSLVQVSMNLVNYEVTGMSEAYNAVRREADKLGVEIEEAEIVGLVPKNALNYSAEYFGRLRNFSEAKILENQIATLCGRDAKK